MRGAVPSILQAEEAYSSCGLARIIPEADALARENDGLGLLVGLELERDAEELFEEAEGLYSAS